ncbi:MAG: hypothetical protein ACP5VP_12120 [Candidatus Limnocylindrales bacterium]
MPVTLRLTLDRRTDVAYLHLAATAPGGVLGPTLLLEPDDLCPGAVAMDVRAADRVFVGFEFQIASACLPAELLVRAARIDGGHLEQRLHARAEPLLQGVRPSRPHPTQ